MIMYNYVLVDTDTDEVVATTDALTVDDAKHFFQSCGYTIDRRYVVMNTF